MNPRALLSRIGSVVPWRLLLPGLLGVLVVAGMVLVAERARDAGESAEQAQIRMRHLQVTVSRIEALTWRNMATSDGDIETVIDDGVELYQGMTRELRALRRLDVERARVAEIERTLGRMYGAGLEALMILRRDPPAARKHVLASFSPAIQTLNDVVDAAVARQDRLATGAERREQIAGYASLGVGMLLLWLLGLHLQRGRRLAALAEQARAAERRSDQRVRALIQNSSDVVMVVDSDIRVQWVSASLERLLGHRPDHLVGRPLADFVSADEYARVVGHYRGLDSDAGASGRVAVTVENAAGEPRQLEAIFENLLDDPVIHGVVISLRDVSERVALEERLRHQAFHDSLTGLANRALFEDRLEHALQRARRGDRRAAVLFVDLDDFKTVNDSLGHAHGDELLVTIADRLRHVLRTGDTAARLGGDEFAILLEDLEDDAVAVGVGERVRALVEQPVTVGTVQLRPAASIGIAYAGPETDLADVLGHADVAMYAAKGRGKGQVAVFEPAMREQVVERLTLTTDLEHAVERGELVLQYQPVVDLDTGEMTGVEALVRWEHPVRGRLAPDRFIAIADSTGLIVPIGEWVLRTACAQLADWRAAGASGLQLGVNVSTRQLCDPGFPGVVRAVLAETGVAAGDLLLEITEHLLADDSAEMRERLAALRAIGVELAVDDFGTGYSALSYLQAFPIGVLKIDRSFVAGIDTDDERARLVQGIIEMGHNLRMRVVAEGIEEPSEAALLRDLRAGFGQGYLFSRPVDPDAITARIAAPLTGAPS